MVWVLLLIGVLLIVFNVKAISKEKSSFNSFYHNEIDNMKDFELKLGELRREFSETILELQKDIVELRRNKNFEEDEDYLVDDDEDKTEEIREGNIEIQEEIINYYHKDSEEVILKDDNLIKDSNESVKKEKQTNNSVKIDEINRLLSEGYSVEDVSTKLGIGKGEVLLIKDLYLK